MPMTPDMARRANGQGLANNRGQRQSDSRGRDTIGRGGSVGMTGHDHAPTLKDGNVRVTQTHPEKPIGFDERANTVHGRPKEQPYDASEGARKVGDVMLAQEPKGRSKHQQDDDRLVGNVKTDATGREGAQQFTIEDGHHARTCR